MSDDIKSCCANFYQSDAARMLLGDVFHPGGLALTHHLGEVVDLTPDSRVLDVACGRGASAVHLAESFGCYVTGVDYGEENVAAAKELAAERGVPHLTAFRVGDAEGLPVESGVFDAVVSECSFCTFPDKAVAAREFVRVLLPGGHLGLTDMTLDGPLPEDIPNLLAWVSCVAGAQRVQSYVETLSAAGLSDFVVEDQQDALLGMVADVRRKLLGVEIAVKLGKLNLGNLDLREGKRLARRAVELIEGGTVGYALVAARKE